MPAEGSRELWTSAEWGRYSSVQSATPWTAARQASLSITNSGSLLKRSWWCHPTISSSVVPFSSCLQPFPASESFPMSQLFASGGQSIGVSASASVLLRAFGELLFWRKEGRQWCPARKSFYHQLSSPQNALCIKLWFEQFRTLTHLILMTRVQAGVISILLRKRMRDTKVK